MSFMPFHIDGTKRTGRTKILACPAADTALHIDYRNLWRILVFRYTRHHLYGSRRAMACTVATLHTIRQWEAGLYPGSVCLRQFHRPLFLDMKELTTDDIAEVNGEKWILSKRYKTKVNFQVKLLDIPMQIIRRYERFQENGLVFPNLDYWSICKPLKQMIRECGITKNIPFKPSWIRNSGFEQGCPH